MNLRKAVFLFVAIVIFVPLAASAAKPQGAQVREFKMTAKKYKFEPKVITVKQGEKVRLIVTALDRTHGFKLEEYGINQKLKKGDPATIEFTADKSGTFVFRCSEFCGIGHLKMKGKLVVEKSN